MYIGDYASSKSANGAGDSAGNMVGFTGVSVGAALFAVLISFASFATAATTQWIGDPGIAEFWEDPASWSTGVPAPGDIALFGPSTGTATINYGTKFNGNASVGTLNIQKATVLFGSVGLANQRTLTVNNNLNLLFPSTTNPSLELADADDDPDGPNFGPVTLDVKGTLGMQSGSWLYVHRGSDVIANNASISNGLITLRGAPTSFTVTNGATFTGSQADLDLRESATATFGSATLASAATFNITQAGRATVGVNSQLTNLTLNTGDVIVSGAGSSFTVNGHSAIYGGGSDQVNVTAGGLATFNGNVSVGNTGGATGGLTFNASTGLITGSLGLADIGTSATGNLMLNDANLTINGSLAQGDGEIDLMDTTLSLGGNLVIGVGTGASQFANLDLDGNSALLMTGNSTVTIGGTAGGTDRVDLIDSSAQFSTGSGETRIEATGIMNMHFGTFDVNGDIRVRGKLEESHAAALFDWETNKTMAIEQGGLVTFLEDYATNFGAIYNVTGTNPVGGARSTLQSATGNLIVGNGATVNVSAGGLITAGAAGANNVLINGGTVNLTSGGRIETNVLTMGTTGTGVLTVDGVGTGPSLVRTLSTTLPSVFGQNGRTATATFSSGAQGEFAGGLELGQSTTSGTSGTINVSSDADLVGVGNINIATLGGSTTQGHLSISGAGSTVSQSSSKNLTVGNGTSGTGTGVGTVDVAGGTLTVGSGGTTTVNATGTVNVSGGVANLQRLVVNSGGDVNVTGGNLNIANGQNTTINSSGSVNINGGSANLQSLSVNGGQLSFTAGSLSYNGGLTVGTGSSAYFGTDLNLSSSPFRSLTLTGSTSVQSSRNLTLSGGVLNTGGLSVSGTTTFNSGTLDVDGSTTIGSGGTLILNSASGFSTNSISNQGTLRFNAPVNLNATLNNTGTTTVASHVTFGQNVSGSGSLQVNGGSSATFEGDYSGGNITGFGDAMFHAEINPSGPITIGGNAALGDDAELNIQLGGTAPGSYDRLGAIGQLSLDGALAVSLFNFTPQAGNSFDVLDWGGSLFGEFDSIALPSLSGLNWDTSQLYETGVLSVIAGLESNGDFTDDGLVNAADIDILWKIIRGFPGGQDPGNNDTADLDGSGLLNEDDVDYLLANHLNPDNGDPGGMYGDADLDGGVGGLDYTAWRLRAGEGWAHGDWDGDGGVGGLDYTLWRTRPTTFPYEVGDHGGGINPVPEPSSVLLLAIGTVAMLGRGLGRVRQRRADG